MEVQIVAKKDNPLLKRTEVTFKAVHKAEPTPKRDAIRQELAKHLKASKDVVVVDHARSTFGKFETLGYAKVYKSKDDAVSVERYYLLVRNQLAAPKAKEAKPAEAAAPPKPARAPPKKEEPKAEPKAEKAPAKEEKKPAEKKPAEKKEEAKGGEKRHEAKKAEPKKKEGD